MIRRDLFVEVLRGPSEERGRVHDGRRSLSGAAHVGFRLDVAHDELGTHVGELLGGAGVAHEGADGVSLVEQQLADVRPDQAGRTRDEDRHGANATARSVQPLPLRCTDHRKQ